MMTSLINILWIFLLPTILIVSTDVSSSITLKNFYVLISTAITHGITYPYINLSVLNNYRKQIFLIITTLLHLNILCFYLYHLFYSPFLTELYLSYIIIPILTNCLYLIKIHKKHNKKLENVDLV
jgi:hypothetical protein